MVDYRDLRGNSKNIPERDKALRGQKKPERMGRTGVGGN